MNRVVGVWWAGGDDDACRASAKGYSSLAFNMAGSDR